MAHCKDAYFFQSNYLDIYCSNPTLQRGEYKEYEQDRALALVKLYHGLKYEYIQFDT